MGLDEFKSEDDSSGGSDSKSNSSNSNNSKNTKSSKSTRNDPYKTVGIGNYVKVFDTEEDWERTVEYIEEEMGYDIDEVLSWQATYTHQALHVAIINSKGIGNEEFDVQEECIVCEHTFKFPHDWDYVEYKGHPVCGEHTYDEVLTAYASLQN